MIKMSGLSLLFCWAILTKKSWLVSIASLAREYTLPQPILKSERSSSTFQVFRSKTIPKFMDYIEMPTLLSSKKTSKNSLKLYSVCSQEVQQEARVAKLPTKLDKEWPNKYNPECLIWFKSKELITLTPSTSSECKKSKDSMSSSKSWRKVYQIFKKPSKVLLSWVLLFKICSFPS